MFDVCCDADLLWPLTFLLTSAYSLFLSVFRVSSLIMRLTVVWDKGYIFDVCLYSAWHDRPWFPTVCVK